VLAAVRPQSAAVEVLFTGADRGFDGGIEQQYQRSLSLADATTGGALLAFELNGAPLPPQHGAPLRLVVPGWYGMANVKWLTHVTLIDSPFIGYQQASAYQLRTNDEELGTPLTRMAPRALMVPPGIPDFFTRRRTVTAGPCRLTGRAWSGWAPIEAVDVSADGGATWWAAELDAHERTAGSWVGWRSEWDAPVGGHELCCRATDAAGNTQPLRGEWNTGGYANNAVHRVPVDAVAG
jgi:DMSO/TMAO reductase YedYZ molybdopterin-dependent catalytic subunit